MSQLEQTFVKKMDPPSRDGRVRSSSRERVLTEKGHQYHIDQVQQQFRHSVSAWRRHTVELELLLCDTHDIRSLRFGRDCVNQSMGKVYESYTILNQLVGDASLHKRYDDIEAENLNLLKLVASYIRDLELECNTRHTTKSVRSCMSKRSISSNASKRQEVVIEAAALKAKLKYLDQEARQKADLEKLQTLKDIDIAEAKLGAMAKVEREDGELSDCLSLPC